MDICALCRMPDEDNVLYGETVKNKRMAVHKFCLYLSSNLSQNGEDDEGFFGFLEPDILKEVKRNSRLHCCYCSKANANIGCCEKRCRRCFHLKCGIKHGAVNQFVNTFKSFCHDHVRKISSGKPGRKEQCCICYENLFSPGQRFSAVNMIRAPCCQNGWFHKVCLQTFANTAGYFFKCPLCNDVNKFCEQLPYKGIFIPERDAAWELEPNAFEELLERPNSCAAETCKCSAGRKGSSNKDPLLICKTCGSVAMHKQCLTNAERGNTFNCSDCKIPNEYERKKSIPTNNNKVEEVEVVDICSLRSDSGADEDDTKIENLNASNEEILLEIIIDILDEDIIAISSDSEVEQNDIVCEKSYISESSSDEFDNLNPFTTLKSSFTTQVDIESGDELKDVLLMCSGRPNTKTASQVDSESLKNYDDNKSCSAVEYLPASKKTRSVNNISPIRTPKPITLDNSCIAHRTRRSIMIKANSTKTTPQAEEKSKSLDTSCVAQRTRRQSLFYEQHFNYSSTSLPTEYQANPSIDEAYNSQTCSTDSRRNSNTFQTVNTSCVSRRTCKRRTTLVTKTQNVDLIDNTSMSYDESSSFATETMSSNPSFKSAYKLYESSLSDEGASCSASSQSRETSRLKVFKKRGNKRRLFSTDGDDFKSAGESRVQRNFRAEVARCPMLARHTNIDPYITPLFTKIDGKLKRINRMDSTQNKDKKRVRRRYNFVGGASDGS